MPLEIRITICDRGTQNVEVVGNKRLALHHGAEAVATVAGRQSAVAGSIPARANLQTKRHWRLTVWETIMAWDEECQAEIDKTLVAHPLREVLYTTISKLIEAKIHQAFYHSGLGGSSYDPDSVVDYQERLLATVICELHKDQP